MVSLIDLIKLSELAATVPDHGTIVEAGSLFGKSSWHLAKNSKPNVKVFCIDPWRPNEKFNKNMERLGDVPILSRAAFEEYTKDVAHKMVLIEGLSPFDVADWDRPVDMYFDDAYHITSEGLLANLMFWAEKIKPGGIMCGHDYEPIFPDVIEYSQLMASRFNSKLEVQGSVWYVRNNLDNH